MSTELRHWDTHLFEETILPAKARWLLGDTFWLEDHIHLGDEAVADLLGCSTKMVRKGLKRMGVWTKAGKYTEVERKAARELCSTWCVTYLSRATARPRKTIYAYMEEEGVARGGRKKGFWPAWRSFVAEHLQDFMRPPLPRRVVIIPRIEGLDCFWCSFHELCNSHTPLPCEDVTLWDFMRGGLDESH